MANMEDEARSLLPTITMEDLLSQDDKKDDKNDENIINFIG